MARVLVLAGDAASLVNFRGHLLRELLKRRCTVIASARPDIKAVSVLQEWGVDFRPIPVNRVGLNPFKDALLLIRFYRLCREVQPDIVLSYTIKPVVYGSMAAKLAGVANVYALITGLGYAFLATGIRGTLLRKVACFLYKIGLRNSSCVFFQNPDDRDYFRRAKIVPERQNVAILNGSGVDLQYFTPVPLPERPVFLLIARLLGDKGVREYAAAAAIIKQEYRDVTFKIAGGFDENPAGVKPAELQAWVKAGTLEHLGRLEDVRPALADCSVFVLPSYREGTPRAVLEAMAMGRPIITTDAPGCRETVQDGVNGFLVSVRDIQKLARAMEMFVRNPEMRARMGAESRRLAVERYDVNKVNAAMLEGMGVYEARN